MLEATSQQYTEMISGNTDTEHFAALYFTYLGDVHKSYTALEMRNAMEHALVKLHTIQVHILGREVSNDMNLCASMGFSRNESMVDILTRLALSGRRESRCLTMDK